MPIHCTFRLNNQTASLLQCPGVGVLPAFSGRNKGRDNPNAIAREEIGPIPPGTYYIVDRQSGGHMGWLWDLWGRYGWGTTDHSQWFMLWNPATGDTTFVGKIKRGQFRIHPEGPRRLSEGCITVTDIEGFKKFAAFLRKRGADLPVPGTTMKAYGTVVVQ
ncbi:MAG TPA: DUF2778 domain-containing protein [Dyella sp.]|uniref:DUF2778 domain-containing protein n=1 Tax=Dyella sp. TaxID=1869338 RepID=UPI002CB97FF6|nr:DUF2778 domain-containing protein [Dyella sp.]HUB90381.1 DUF2778 domain-containing protein [Dyella sp.]